MADQYPGDDPVCPIATYDELVETFDFIDLSKICEFLSKDNGVTCKVVMGWYAADLGIDKNGKASLCLDIDPNVENHLDPSAVFIYKGPREKDSPCTVALGKVKTVQFIKIKGKTQSLHVVEIEDTAGTILHFSEKDYQLFSPAYPTAIRT